MYRLHQIDMARANAAGHAFGHTLGMTYLRTAGHRVPISAIAAAGSAWYFGLTATQQSALNASLPAMTATDCALFPGDHDLSVAAPARSSFTYREIGVHAKIVISGRRGDPSAV